MERLTQYGMWGFIIVVIIAGMFGPWMMSLLLGTLALLCGSAQLRDNGRHRSF